MNTTSSSGMGIGIVWLHLHWFFGASAIVGFILLIIWATREFEKEKLKSFVIWLLVIGITGALLTAVPAMSGFRQMMNTWNGGSMMMRGPMMMQMMEKMMDHKDGKSEREHEEMEEMMKSMRPPQAREAMNQENTTTP